MSAWLARSPAAARVRLRVPSVMPNPPGVMFRFCAATPDPYASSRRCQGTTAPAAWMLTAKTAASASQLARARPVTVIQPDTGRRSDPSRSAQARATPPGSPAGRRNTRDQCRRIQATSPSSDPRIRGRRAAVTAAARAAAATRPAATAATVAGKFPDDRPPPITMSTPAPVEATPPTSKTQPASGASAPSLVKRRNVKAVPSSGPASGTETDSALAAKVVASMGRTPTWVSPASSSRRCMPARAAMDADSSTMAAGIQIQSRWASDATDAATAAHLITPALASAAMATTAAATQARYFPFRCRDVAAPSLTWCTGSMADSCRC